MTLSADTLAYDFDEEADGFAEPETPHAHPTSLTAGHRLSLALVALGLVSLVVQTSGGPWAGTWHGLASSLGLLAVGTALTFWQQLRDTTPGIKHDGIMFSSLLARGALGWIAGVGMTGLYVLLYWFPEVLGQPVNGGEPTGLIRVVDPLARVMTGYPASQWFLYGVLYTAAILVFGVRMWMKYRHNRYHRIRTLSVAFFQLVFAWLLPNLLVLLRQPYMEFNGIDRKSVV